MYNFILSVYFMLIHDITGTKIVPLVTNTSIRGYVPALENVLTRCINEIPVVGVVDPTMSSKEHLKENSLRLNAFTENGAYPFQLIKEEMEPEELRKYIGRNRFVVDNISTLSKHSSNEGITVKISSVQHRRHTYETCLFLYQDIKKKVLMIELGFNTGVISETVARSILNRFEYLIFRLVSDDSHITVRDLLDESAKTKYWNKDSNTHTGFNTLFEGKHVNHSRQSDEKSIDNLISHVKEIEQRTNFSGLQEIMRGNVEILSKSGYLTTAKLHLLRLDSSNGAVFLFWKTYKRKKKIGLMDIKEVHIKKWSGRFALFIKIEKNWTIFLVKDLATARDWFSRIETTLKQLSTA